MGGTPSHHPFTDGTFPWKVTLQLAWGTPIPGNPQGFWGSIHLWTISHGQMVVEIWYPKNKMV